MPEQNKGGTPPQEQVIPPQESGEKGGYYYNMEEIHKLIARDAALLEAERRLGINPLPVETGHLSVIAQAVTTGAKKITPDEALVQELLPVVQERNKHEEQAWQLAVKALGGDPKTADYQDGRVCLSAEMINLNELYSLDIKSFEKELKKINWGVKFQINSQAEANTMKYALERRGVTLLHHNWYWNDNWRWPTKQEVVEQG